MMPGSDICLSICLDIQSNQSGVLFGSSHQPAGVFLAEASFSSTGKEYSISGLYQPSTAEFSGALGRGFTKLAASSSYPSENRT